MMTTRKCHEYFDELSDARRLEVRFKDEMWQWIIFHPACHINCGSRQFGYQDEAANDAVTTFKGILEGVEKTGNSRQHSRTCSYYLNTSTCSCGLREKT